jgi:serine/threonine protein phosphatase PrpC
MSYQDVVDVARDSLRTTGDVNVACQKLVRRAMELKTTDNVSVLIICLNQ